MHLPSVFSDRMRSDLGQEFSDFIQALEKDPPVSIRLNPSKPAALSEKEDRVPWHPHGFYLPSRPVFTLDPLFHAGAYYVQEASSMFLYEVLRQTTGLQRDLKVLDLCASPGGKSTLLLSALSDGSMVLSNEVIRSRIPALRTNLTRWGYANSVVSNHDPDDFLPLREFFDVILIDAPCSGEGMFRKDHASILEWSPENVSHCAARQRRILKRSPELLKPGGVLIYSTCTYNHEENTGNVDWLLESGQLDYLPLELDPSWGIAEKAHGYQFYPHRLRGEGFFTAVLRKTGSANNSHRLKNKKVFEGWTRLSKKEAGLLGDWIVEPEAFRFLQKPNGHIVAVPEQMQADWNILGEVLHRRSFGIYIGQLKNDRFIPAHDLALSTIVHPGLPFLELDKQEALNYLKKDSLPVKGPKGWTLARYRGINLGWMKILDNRINNYLPNEWRIRMELSQ